MSRTHPLPPVKNREEDANFSEGVLSANYRQLTLGLILIILGPAFETLAVATILPKIVADLGGLSFYGWSFSAYMLATLVGLILAGDEAEQRARTCTAFHGRSGSVRAWTDTGRYCPLNDRFRPK